MTIEKGPGERWKKQDGTRTRDENEDEDEQKRALISPEQGSTRSARISTSAYLGSLTRKNRRPPSPALRSMRKTPSANSARLVSVIQAGAAGVRSGLV